MLGHCPLGRYSQWFRVSRVEVEVEVPVPGGRASSDIDSAFLVRDCGFEAPFDRDEFIDSSWLDKPSGRGARVFTLT
jgi:hypothetical protein